MDGCEIGRTNLVDFQIAVSSQVDQFDFTLDRIIRLIRRLPCVGDNLDDVALALSEALANAILHGNRQDPSKHVQSRGGCERSGDLVLAITDKGDGFGHSVVPDPTTRKARLSDHGRGLFLIHQLMDRVEFGRGGRQIVMHKRVR